MERASQLSLLNIQALHCVLPHGVSLHRCIEFLRGPPRHPLPSSVSKNPICTKTHAHQPYTHTNIITCTKIHINCAHIHIHTTMHARSYTHTVLARKILKELHNLVDGKVSYTKESFCSIDIGRLLRTCTHGQVHADITFCTPMYTHSYSHAHTHKHKHAETHACAHMVYLHIHVYICLSLSTIHIYIYICMYVCMYAYMNIYIYIYIYIYIQIHVYTGVHTHTLID